jgi:hypothetical protein
LLLLGAAARQQHSALSQQHAAGVLPLSPVLQANVLGVCVGFDSPVDWGQKLASVDAALARLSHIPQLSVFGRGMGSAAYGVSTLLYAAEFSDLPPDVDRQRLVASVGKLVDRGLAPASSVRRFTGVAARFLAGRPAEGGFGALPWVQHMRARHAWWGAQFATAPPDTEMPWIRIGRALLRSKHKWWGPLSLFDSFEDTQTPMEPSQAFPQQSLPPPPLRRMIAGLQALGQVCDVKALAPAAPAPALPPPHPQQLSDMQQLRQQLQAVQDAPVLQPGAWCSLAPVFANPFLQAIIGFVPGGLQMLPVPSVHGPHACSGGKCRPRIRTVADLCRAWHVIKQAARQQWPHPLLPYGSNFSNADNEAADLTALVNQLPVAWHRAALAIVRHPAADRPWPPAAVPDPPCVPSVAEQHVEAMLVARLGWQNHQGKAVSVARLSVREATSLQLGPLRAERQERRTRFVSVALGAGAPPEALTRGLRCVAAAQGALWKLRWDNEYKETYWRLVMDGLPTSHRMHQLHDACMCGAACPGQVHHFWVCPVAVAVIDSLLSALPATWCTRAAGRPPLAVRHVWLMQRPPGPKRLRQGVWAVVCLAALNAMDVGRRHADKLRIPPPTPAAPRPSAPPPLWQVPITDVFQPTALTATQQQHNQLVEQRRQQQQLQQQQQRQQLVAQVLQEAKQQAVLRFWELLADFVAMEAAPAHWRVAVPGDHPFLRSDPAQLRIVLAPRSG